MSSHRQLEKNKRPVQQRKAAERGQANNAQPQQYTIQRVVVDPARLTAADMLQLQRTVGNRALTGILSGLTAGNVQTKLSITNPGDYYEREADRIAQRVTEMPDPGYKQETAGVQAPLQGEVSAGGKEEIAVGQLIQRRSDGSLGASPGLESRLNSSQGGGSPLPEGVRSGMEPRFKADFSNVRIHADSEAGKLSRDINARAFTRGRDIYFGSGEYNPEAPAGQKLLAHELTHTMQQGASKRIAGWWPQGHRNITQTALTKGNFSDSYDEEARKFLIERSPDMDGLKDEFSTMRKGQGEGKAIIKGYNKLKKSKKESDKDQAKQMYLSNQLHIRDQSYMLHHGEGGFYKKEDGSSINEGMTSLFVDRAIGLWNTGNKERALVVLSDALHQAEDRGAHQEGNAYQGHDSRLKLNETEWEKAHFNNNWDPGKSPDDISVNKGGAAKAVGLAQGTLNKFQYAVNANEEDKISIRKKDKPEQRGLTLGVSARFGGRFLGNTGVKDEDGLTKMLKEEKSAYKGAIKEPEVREELSEDDKADLYEGMAFYEKATRKEAKQDEYMDAEKKFKGLNKSRLRGGESKEKRRKEARTYYERKINKLHDDKKQQTIVGSLIKAAYKDVTGEELEV